MFKVIMNFMGTLLPLVFPNQKFKPLRLGAVVVCFVIAVGSVEYMGVENTLKALEVAEDLIELTEE
tara:strand:+ start:835 stop:1032 length:198 start_codon:yes stop_codon:yes gene_type:complete